MLPKWVDLVKTWIEEEEGYAQNKYITGTI
jgi:hypothetical protein